MLHEGDPVRCPPRIRYLAPTGRRPLRSARRSSMLHGQKREIPTTGGPPMCSAASPRDRGARSGAAGAYLVQGLCFAALLTQVDVLKDKFGFSAAELSLVLLAVPVVAGLGSVVAVVLARLL